MDADGSAAAEPASHDAFLLTALGRLRPGVSVGQATAELDIIACRIASGILPTTSTAAQRPN
jgi:hypothetical protein